MFKFLRKYNKWILAVGGTLLMIVFLIPQAIQSLSQQAAIGSSVWGTVGEDGTEVTGEERRRCEKELEVLDALQRATPQLGITDQAEHWYLLLREADAAGLLGGLGSDQLPDSIMQVYYNVGSVVASPQLVNETVGKRLAVDRLLGLYQGASKLSDTRLRREAERLFHSVDLRSIMLAAEADDAAPDPSEDALLTQFEEYSDVAPGAGDDGFGYRLPDRFKLEWATVSRDAARALVEATDAEDGVALMKHWQREVDAKGFPPYEDTDVPEEVREDFINTRTDELLTRIERFANDQLVTSRRRLSSLDGYYVLPEDWAEKRLDLRDLATQVEAEFAGLELPAYEAIGDRWLELSDLATLEGLAGASTDAFTGQSATVASLVAAAKELTANPAMPIQAGVAGPALRLPSDQSLILFRITEIEPARAPEDLDEVRDAVVADVKRKQAYEELKARADSLLARAKQDGLLTLAMDEGIELQRLESVTPFNTFLLNFQLQNNAAVTQQPSTLPIVGAHLPTIEAIIDRALALPDDQPILDMPAAERMSVETIDDKMVIMLYEIVGEESVTEETYTQLVTNGALQRLVRGGELEEDEETILDVFGRDAMVERHHFQTPTVPTTQPDDLIDEATDEATAAVGG